MTGYLQKLTNVIESVQRKSARWICNKWQYDESPSAMIKDLNLISLQERRRISRLSTLYELHHGLKYMPAQTIARQRCVDLRFRPMLGALQVYANSFYPCTVREWNKLPANIVNSGTLEGFKNRLLKHMN